MMKPEHERNNVFGALKQILKAQGIRYRDLAEMLDMSEPTIKRLFQEQDCKMSRLLEICEILGVSLNDLVELADQVPSEPISLPLETEQVLAETPGLFSCFILLLSGFDAQAIAQHNSLTTPDVYLYLRELEKLQLIRLGLNDAVHMTVKLPVKWRLDGPLHHTLVEVNKAFIAQAITDQHQGGFPFYSSSRLLSQHSLRQLHLEIDNLYSRFQQQASLDQLFYPPEALSAHKLVTTMADFNVPDYFPVPERS